MSQRSAGTFRRDQRLSCRGAISKADIFSVSAVFKLSKVDREEFGGVNFFTGSGGEVRGSE